MKPVVPRTHLPTRGRRRSNWKNRQIGSFVGRAGRVRRPSGNYHQSCKLELIAFPRKEAYLPGSTHCAHCRDTGQEPVNAVGNRMCPPSLPIHQFPN
ncbi:hypothetical protein N658DRAFT_67486 [Parathielavia hyrcaniae]|uniref:Uncharacterized protein n=1 Tax=Parathielavia hyrcaniae TaxID=113614 RepID=A0AAN6Q0G2_9PEZI|nr:hypothetical protein N658DRAFT_67486 [Parathielavia hyrcaniae]